MTEAKERSIRISRSLAECDLLEREISDWYEVRKEADSLGQYHTQLDTLWQVLGDAIRELRRSVDAIRADLSLRGVYVRSRRLDLRITWLRRVWLYFKVKFDQRDNPLLRDVLLAADEIVWSCYADVFANLKRTSKAAPLCYIEPLYSPQAIPRTDPPRQLESNVDRNFLKTFLQQLPIPVIGLPTACVRSPWSLIYIAHEAGHHVQHDLASRFVLGYKDAVVAAARGAGVAPAAAESWGNWGQEIFADLFSVYCVGPMAAMPIAELELMEEEDMLNGKTLYPAPLVRLALLREAASQLGKSLPCELPETVETQIESIKARLNASPQADEVAKALGHLQAIVKSLQQKSFDGIGTMAEFTGWRKSDFQGGGDVYRHQQTLLQGDVVNTGKVARSARLIIAGGYRAWRSMVSAENEQAKVEADLKRLRSNLLTSLRMNRPEGTRAAAPAPVTEVPDGAAWARQLMDLPDAALVDGDHDA